MPGATSLGIPYPIQPEVVNSLSYKNMADAIDTLMTSLDTLRDVALQRPFAQISGGSANAIVSATTTQVTAFTNVTYDTGSYANLGAFPNQLTVPPGIYMASAAGLLGSVTTLAMARLMIFTAASTLWAGDMLDTVSSSTSFTLSSPTALILCTAPTTAIQAYVRWQGTGGPPNATFVTLQVMQVRQLADL